MVIFGEICDQISEVWFLQGQWLRRMDRALSLNSVWCVVSVGWFVFCDFGWFRSEFNSFPFELVFIVALFGILDRLYKPVARKPWLTVYRAQQVWVVPLVDEMLKMNLFGNRKAEPTSVHETSILFLFFMGQKF